MGEAIPSLELYPLLLTAAAPCLGVVAPGLGGAAAEGDHAGARLHVGSNWL